MDWTTTYQDPDELRAAFAGRPDGRYRPITAWWWSGERLDEDRLLWQLDRIAELGCGGHAVTGLALHGPSAGAVADDPPGFSPEWLALFRRIAERSAELGLALVSWSPLMTGKPVDVPAVLRDHPEYRGELVSPVLTLGGGTIRTGVSWHHQGLDCFSGVIAHRCSFTAPRAGAAVLDLGEVRGSVGVRVNGVSAGRWCGRRGGSRSPWSRVRTSSSWRSRTRSGRWRGAACRRRSGRRTSASPASSVRRSSGWRADGPAGPDRGGVGCPQGGRLGA